MSWIVGLVFLLGLMSGCAREDGLRVREEMSLIPRLDLGLTRIAVLIPPTNDPTLAYAYARLETMTDHLLRGALGSLVVERAELNPIQAEQHWQHAQPAAEETTARLGRLSGADALILYRILSPTRREMLFAPEGSLSPVTIIGKVVRVETGEVVWNHLVSIDVRPVDRWRGASIGFDPGVRQALDHGVKAMEAALTYAVHCRNQECRVGMTLVTMH